VSLRFLSAARFAPRKAMLKSALKEPLVHFAVLSALIFGVYWGLAPTTSERSDRIVVTRAKIDQLASIFATTWQRQPLSVELKGLIDDYVKEEVYYREGVALGLDRNDNSIRRRIRQKLEFLIDAEADATTPGDAEVSAYLQAHRDKFALEPQLDFRQVYLNPQQHGEKVGREAAALLKKLRHLAPNEGGKLGDATILPSELAATSLTQIGRIFGTEFAQALDKMPPREWSGPIKSAYGLHLVWIEERKEGRVPPLDEIRSAVQREWASDRRKDFERARYKQLLNRYEVSIEAPPAAEAGR